MTEENNFMEQRRLEELIRFSKLFSYMFETPYLLIDFHTNQVMHTSAEFFQFFGVDKNVEMEISTFVHPDDEEFIVETYRQTKRKIIEIFHKNRYPCLFVVFNIRMRLGAGIYKYVRCNYRPVHFDEKGQPLYYVLYFTTNLSSG